MAPFEVMRGGDARKAIGESPSPTRSVSGGAGRGEAGERGSMLDRWRSPVVLRLPRGTIVALLVLAVGLIGLAYWVGQSMGYSSAVARLRQSAGDRPWSYPAGATTPGGAATGGAASAPGGEASQTPGSDAPTAARATGGLSAVAAQTTGGVNQPDGPVDASATALSSDTRQSGLNYLVLATYPPEEAQRLRRFLAAHGVAAAAVSVNNGRFFLVVDLVGFTAEDLRTPAYEQRRMLIRRLGELWRKQERGPSDLSDMWPQKYRG